MKKWIAFLAVSLCGCATWQAPSNFVYQEIKTPHFTLAAWVKDSGSIAPLHIYIEGDGYAFNSNGRPSDNPTPKSKLMREMAFADEAANVVY